MTNLEKVVDVLVRRDKMERDEAMEYCREVALEMNHQLGLGNFQTTEDIFMSEFGLEPDYLNDFIIDFLT